jgi:hypothetical protein
MVNGGFFMAQAARWVREVEEVWCSREDQQRDRAAGSDKDGQWGETELVRFWCPKRVILTPPNRLLGVICVQVFPPTTMPWSTGIFFGATFRDGGNTIYITTSKEKT